MASSVQKYLVNLATYVTIKRGDITKEQVDAIVNAANEQLTVGGGVSGAIHRAAGPKYTEACLKVPEVRRGVRCPTGEARIVTGGQLPAPYVINTVGPVYSSVPNPAELLESCYRSVLQVANEKGLSSVAFPAISCGIFGYPLREAAQVALVSCQKYHGNVKDIRFVLFGSDVFEAWTNCAESLSWKRAE
jgi:O-acetyl-ADP-ribose deacetylase (regulator of RNase III)